MKGEANSVRKKNSSATNAADFKRFRQAFKSDEVLDTHNLRKVLSIYAAYYNQTRTHLALNKDCPLERPVQRFGSIAAVPILDGFHHHYARI